MVSQDVPHCCKLLADVQSHLEEHRLALKARHADTQALVKLQRTLKPAMISWNACQAVTCLMNPAEMPAHLREHQLKWQLDAYFEHRDRHPWRPAQVRSWRPQASFGFRVYRGSGFRAYRV